eukprot:6457366-Amphidinium_carterae.1
MNAFPGLFDGHSIGAAKRLLLACWLAIDIGHLFVVCLRNCWYSSSCSRRPSRVPCSVSRGLPLAGLVARVGLAALSPSLGPVAGAGGREFGLSLFVTGSPGVSALDAFLSLSTCSARALA